MASFLVTGGGGFIGSHLVEELVKRGEKVRVLDDFSRGKRGNLDPVRNSIELIEGDIREQSTVRDVTKGIDFVLHQVAMTPRIGANEDLLDLYDVNVVGTWNILEAAQRTRVKRLVFASSYVVYGFESEIPVRENMAPKVSSPYSETKLIAEQDVQAFTYAHGLQTVILRYFNVFGPRQNLDSTYTLGIPQLIKNVSRNEPLGLFGNSGQIFDFTYVANIVNANLLAITSKEIIPGRVFNIGTGCGLSLGQIVDYLRDSRKCTNEVEFVNDPSTNFIYPNIADIRRAQASLGYEPVLLYFERLGKLIVGNTEEEK
jgi:nucleoside-diphosphate-sugar epimerase